MITHYASQKILSNMFALSNSTFGSQCYLGLSTTEPNQAKGENNWNVSEPGEDGTGYERILLGDRGSSSNSTIPESVRLIEFNKETQTYITNKKEIHFNIATTDWGTISYVCIFEVINNKTSNLLAYGAILKDGEPTSINVTQGSVVVIPVNGFKIGIDDSLGQ